MLALIALMLTSFAPIHTSTSRVAQANQYFVAINGSDVTGDGASDRPWATPQRAVNQIVTRGLNVGMASDITVLIGPGTYWDTNLTITDAANPDNGHTITMAAMNGIDTVRLVGGHTVTTSGCAIYSGSIYRCPVSATFWTLFENGVRAVAARTPNLVYNASFPVAAEPFLQAENVSSYTALTYKVGDLNPAGWVATDVRVWGSDGPNGARWYTGIQPGVTINSGTRVIQTASQMKYNNANKYYIVQNDLSMLDQQGEWYLDRSDAHGAAPGGQHYLYYWPRSTPITSQEIIYPTTLDTFSMIGADQSHVVHGWTIQNITIDVSDFVGDYRYAAWGTGGVGDYDPTVCLGHDPYACGWAFERAEPNARHGMIHLSNVEDVTFNRVRARYSGLAAMYVQLHAQRVTISNSKIEHCGFDCLQFEAGYPGEGDKSNANTISNNKINNPGELLQHGAGLRLANSGHNLVSHNTFDQGPRDAVFLTDVSSPTDGVHTTEDGYCFGNIIVMNSANGFGQDSGDMGVMGFYALGSLDTDISPKHINYVSQFLITNTGAHPGMTDLAPNCVFTDDQTWYQDIRNVDCMGGTRRNHAPISGGHAESNDSWLGAMVSALDPAVGVTSANPY